jgi:hypothetical protein
VLQYPGLCQLFPVLFLTAQHLSPLLVLAFTTERYVSVCHPFARERFWSTRRPLATVGALTSFALAVNAVQAYFWTYDSDKGECGIRDEVPYVYKDIQTLNRYKLQVNENITSKRTSEPVQYRNHIRVIKVKSRACCRKIEKQLRLFLDNEIKCRVVHPAVCTGIDIQTKPPVAATSFKI